LLAAALVPLSLILLTALALPPALLLAALIPALILALVGTLGAIGHVTSPH
jgi:hypothetical protein